MWLSIADGAAGPTLAGGEADERSAETNMSSSYGGYDAAHTAVALGQRGLRGWICVGGADAVSFLHGILTNDVASLGSGRWC